MLETPSIQWYSFMNVAPCSQGGIMSSENPSGADNQQERLDAYIAGFVDGEGASADTSLVFVVRKREDLLTKVIPFFETQPLVSSKRRDFLTFARIVRSMTQEEHLTADSFAVLVTAALHERRRAIPTSARTQRIQNPQRPYAEHRREVSR
jgi:hypothetical protein